MNTLLAFEPQRFELSPEFGYEAESGFELEAPSASVSTSCDTSAVRAIPSYLDPKLVACLSAVVPIKNVEWLLNLSLREREPNWVKQLTADITQQVPTVKIGVEIFRFIPVFPTDARVLKGLRAYIEARKIRFYSSAVGPINGKKDIESKLGLSLDDLYRQAGVSGQLTTEEFRRHVILVYAAFPDSTAQYVRFVGNYTLDKFEFDKSELRDFHQPMIATIARDIVESWFTAKVVTTVYIKGHTDETGTRAYNHALGERRAKTVEQKLRQEVDRIAPSTMAGSVKKIKYDVESLGKDAPISPGNPALNRRVELSFDYTRLASFQPMPLDQVIARCLRLLRGQKVLYAGADKILACILNKLKNLSTDDRYVNRDNVFAIGSSNKIPDPEQWNRMRFYLVNPNYFGAGIKDEQVLKNLEVLDRGIIEGVQEINRTIAYHEGIPISEGASLPKAIREIRSWVDKRVDESNSVYSCFKEIFKP